MELHPLAEVFPRMTDEEFDSLCDDIEAQGLLDPIITFEGKIIDGRHRYEACLQVDVEPRFVEYEGDDALAFVIAKNMNRRHLTTSQRAMVAAGLATMTVGRPEEIPQKCGISAKEAANQLNVSTRTVETARKVLREADPEVIQAVRSGNMTVGGAIAQMQAPRSQPTLDCRRTTQGTAIALKALAEFHPELIATELAAYVESLVHTGSDFETRFLKGLTNLSDAAELYLQYKENTDDVYH